MEIPKAMRGDGEAGGAGSREYMLWQEDESNFKRGYIEGHVIVDPATKSVTITEAGYLKIVQLLGMRPPTRYSVHIV